MLPMVQVAQAVVAAYDSGELPAAVAEGADGYKGWVKGLGKAQKRKGKRLFMPLRVALTGTSHVRLPPKCMSLAKPKVVGQSHYVCLQPHNGGTGYSQ